MEWRFRKYLGFMNNNSVIQCSVLIFFWSLIFFNKQKYPCKINRRLTRLEVRRIISLCSLCNFSSNSTNSQWLGTLAPTTFAVYLRFQLRNSSLRFNRRYFLLMEPTIGAKDRSRFFELILFVLRLCCNSILITIHWSRHVTKTPSKFSQFSDT